MVSEISGLYELKGVKHIPGESNVFVNECDLSKETIICKVIVLYCCFTSTVNI